MNQADTQPVKRGAGSRLAFGCLGIILVVVLALGGAAWWFVLRPLQAMAAVVEQVVAIERLDERVNNRSTYQPPADGVLEEAQVERYTAVLAVVQRDLSDSLRKLQQRYEDLDGRQPELLDIPRLAGAYLELFTLLVQAKEAQVAGLNAEGFSLEEYRWVRSQILGALGFAGAGYDISDFAQAFADGRDPSTRGTLSVPVPEANRVAVEAFKDRLEEVAFLALFGL